MTNAGVRHFLELFLGFDLDILKDHPMGDIDSLNHDLLVLELLDFQLYVKILVIL